MKKYICASNQASFAAKQLENLIDEGDYRMLLDSPIMEEYIDEAMASVEELLNEKGYWTEPSTQMRRGTDYLLDLDTDRTLGTWDYESEVWMYAQCLVDNNMDIDATAHDMVDWILEQADVD